MKWDCGTARRIARENYRGASSSASCWRAPWWANPSVLLADEPTGSLDFRTGEMIMGLIEDLHRARRLTSIHVTHNLKFARRADRILKLERGGLSETAPSSICQK